MASKMNGITLHGSTRIYGGTFLSLLRLHAHAGAPVRADAAAGRRTCGRTTPIGLGEDGPTHQPVEHLAALRAIPEPQPLVRPADANEIARAVAEIRRHPPADRTGLALTRQGVPT